MVIEHGAVPIFVRLLASPSDDVREQVHVLIYIVLQLPVVCGLKVS